MMSLLAKPRSLPSFALNLIIDCQLVSWIVELDGIVHLAPCVVNPTGYLLYSSSL